MAGITNRTSTLNYLVDTRNKISHGDPSATKTPSEVKDMVSIVKKYCSETDSVFAT
ncbi:MAG: HEPN domain-containing protein [Candidatus Thiodiazotropha sp.]